MPGLQSDYLVYPILDLVRNEIKRHLSSASPTTAVQGWADPFEGIPSITVHRGHPLDPNKVVGATSNYLSGYSIEVDFSFGDDAVPLNYPDYEYIRDWRLANVMVTTIDPDGNVVSTFNIRLNYDSSGSFVSTEVVRVE